MTIDEAISILEQIGRHECIWIVCRHNEVYKAIDMAIEALNKQDKQDKEKAFAKHLKDRCY